MPELRITDESGARVFPWNGEEVFCGRNPDNTLVLAEKKASRKHCRFFREGAFYRVEDLKSSNGTVVAGARVTVHTLAPGDTVQIGASTIQFVDTAPAAPPPPAATPPDAPAQAAGEREASEAEAEAVAAAAGGDAGLAGAGAGAGAGDDRAMPGAKQEAEASQPAPADPAAPPDAPGEPPQPPSLDDIAPPVGDGVPEVDDGEFLGTFVKEENVVYLEALEGPLSGKHFDFTTAVRLTAGRKPGNDIVLAEDKRASGQHAEFTRDEQGAFSVTDLGSSNGTYVNGERIQGAMRIYSDDEIRVGDTLLRFKNPREEVVADAHFREKKKEKQELIKVKKEEQKEERSKVLFFVGLFVVVGVVGVAAVLALSGYFQGEEKKGEAIRQLKSIAIEGNLVARNFSFEDELNERHLPAGWEVEYSTDLAGKVEVKRDGERARTGEHSLRLAFTGAQPHSYAEVFAVDRVQTRRGASYLATAQARTEGGAGLVRLRLSWRNGDVEVGEDFSNGVTAAADWQSLICKAAAPAEATSARVSLLLAGRLGTVWLDDVVCKEGGPAGAPPRFSETWKDPDWGEQAPGLATEVSPRGLLTLSANGRPVLRRGRFLVVSPGGLFTEPHRLGDLTPQVYQELHEFRVLGDTFNLAAGKPSSWQQIVTVAREGVVLRLAAGGDLLAGGAALVFAADLAPELIAGGQRLEGLGGAAARDVAPGGEENTGFPDVADVAWRQENGDLLVASFGEPVEYRVSQYAPTGAAIRARVATPSAGGALGVTVRFSHLTTRLRADGRRLEDEARRAEGEERYGAAMATLQTMIDTLGEHRGAVNWARARRAALTDNMNQEVATARKALMELRGSPKDAERRAAFQAIIDSLKRRYGGTAGAAEADQMQAEFKTIVGE